VLPSNVASSIKQIAQQKKRFNKESMTSYPREIKNYITPEGKIPFSDWSKSLRDINAKAKIRAALKRVALGNLGDYKSVGEGVCELRINYGPGYRIYFGQIGSTIILL
jgi:putative addiction module killer protein